MSEEQERSRGGDSIVSSNDAGGSPTRRQQMRSARRQSSSRRRNSLRSEALLLQGIKALEEQNLPSRRRSSQQSPSRRRSSQQSIRRDSESTEDADSDLHASVGNLHCTIKGMERSLSASKLVGMEFNDLEDDDYERRYNKELYRQTTSELIELADNDLRLVNEPPPPTHSTVVENTMGESKQQSRPATLMERIGNFADKVTGGTTEENKISKRSRLDNTDDYHEPLRYAPRHTFDTIDDESRWSKNAQQEWPQMPGIPSDIDIAPTASRFGSRPRLLLIIATILCASAVALAVSVFIAVFAHSGSVGGGAGAVGSYSEEEQSRIVAVKQAIINSGATSTDKLDGTIFPPTPQYQALMWLALGDPGKIDANDIFLLQRYALAVFWYSTFGMAKLAEGGKEAAAQHYWTDHTNWMTGKGICSWHGISCQFHPDTDAAVKYDGNHRVTHVQLPSNSIKGTVPPELFLLLSDLRHLDLSDNQISGSISTEIGTMTQMRSLYLYSNEITGWLPETIGELTALRELDLSDNSMSGPIPEAVGNLANLSLLGMFDNGFTGQIPTTIGQLSLLEVLYLDDNKLAGTLPESIFRLKKLFDVRLNKNNIGGTIPQEAASDLSDLELLYLDENELTGQIPSSLSKLKRLSSLRLFKNKLSGSLPPEFGELTFLDHLSVDSNQLSGTIPPEWGKLSHLAELFIHGNALFGSLPTDIGLLKNLKDFRVHNNEITGEIPSEVGTMYRLEYLYLDNNRLKGVLPAEIGSLDKLAHLRINGNVITGEVGQEICELRKMSLQVFASDCAGVSSDIKCECCTECF